MGYSRILSLLALGPLVLAAAEENPKKKTKAEVSATVTVTAEATPVEVAKTPNMVHVIDGEALARTGARNLAELMGQFLPGQVMGNGGAGTVTSLFLGGTRNQDVVVTLDGLRLTDATGVGLNLSDISMIGVERVEIQQGPSSTLQGSDAMGGVIALYTGGSTTKGISGSTTLALGTQGFRQLNSSDAFGWGKGWARVAITASRQAQPTRTDNPFRTSSGFFQLGQQLTNSHLLTVTYRNSYQAAPIPWLYPDFTDGVHGYDASRESRIRTEQMGASLQSVIREDLSFEASLGQAIQTRQEPKYGGGLDPSDSRRNQGRFSLNWKGVSHSLSLVLDGSQEFAKLTDTTGFGFNAQGQGQHWGMALEASWEPLSAIRVVASVREQVDRQRLIEMNGVEFQATRNDQFTYKGGINLLLPSGFRAYLSGGTGFSNPLLYQVMTNAAQGGEILNNERSRFFQAGMGWKQGPWNLSLDAGQTRFTTLVFYRWPRYFNGSNLRIQSLEGKAGYQAIRWGVTAFARTQEARDLNAPEGQQLSSPAVVRRPFFTSGLRADLTQGAWRADIHWSWTGSRYDVLGFPPPTYQPHVAPSRNHFNDLGVGFTWQASPSVSLSVKGEHLLQPRISKEDWISKRTDFMNDAYLVYNYPAPAAMVGIELKVRY